MNKKTMDRVRFHFDNLIHVYRSRRVKNLLNATLSEEVIDPMIYMNDHSLHDACGGVFDLKTLFGSLIYLYKDNYLAVLNTYHGKHVYLYYNSLTEYNRFIDIKKPDNTSHFCRYFELFDKFGLLITFRNADKILIRNAFVLYDNLIINSLSFDDETNYKLTFKCGDENSNMFFELPGRQKQKLISSINSIVILLKLKHLND